MKLLENLSKELKTDIQTRRYNLSEMISESYKTLYECEEGSNLYKIAEAHLQDVKNHPTDIERLSENLSTLKTVSRLVKTGRLNDRELVEKKRVPRTPVKESRRVRGKRLKESRKTPGYRRRMNEDNLAIPRKSLAEAEEPELTEEELDELTKHLAEIRKKKPMAESVDNLRVWQLGVDILCPESEMSNVRVAIEKAVYNVSSDCSVAGIEWSGASWTTEEYGYKVDESVEDFDDNKGKVPLTDVKDEVEGEEDRVILKPQYESINLAEFGKASSGKAFYKTLKKMQDSLKEGKALTRQESINLYKAANSAMTQLSIELEHNPKFLSTFNECTSALAKDVNGVLGALKENKAPSKKTMKSLAKFTESLLNESDSEEMLISKALDYMYGTDRKEKDSEYSDEEKQRAIDYYFEKTDPSPYDESKKVNESEDEDEDIEDPEVEEEEPTGEDIEDEPTEEDIPDIDTDDDFIADDEGDMMSEEAEEFYQEYADARQEILDDLRDKYEDSEDPQIQSMLDQEAAEVEAITGEPEEEEIDPEDMEDPEAEPEEGEDVEEPTEDEEEPVDDSDITDDELAELKRHLEEMRSAKRNLKESEENLVDKVKSALDDAGISYTTRGRSGSSLLVSKGDLQKASDIRNEIDPEYTVTVQARA